MTLAMGHGMKVEDGHGKTSFTVVINGPRVIYIKPHMLNSTGKRLARRY